MTKNPAINNPISQLFQWLAPSWSAGPPPWIAALRTPQLGVTSTSITCRCSREDRVAEAVRGPSPIRATFVSATTQSRPLPRPAGDLAHYVSVQATIEGLRQRMSRSDEPRRLHPRRGRPRDRRHQHGRRPLQRDWQRPWAAINSRSVSESGDYFFTLCTAGGCQVPSMIDGTVSCGQ